MAVSLKDVEAMVDKLGPTDRVRLLQYLVPRLTETVIDDLGSRAAVADAWREFRRVGERLAATSNGESITKAITDMRR